MPDGTKFEGIVGVRDLLVKRPYGFVNTMTEKLLTYAIGRSLEYYDSSAVRGILRRAERNDYRFSSLILGIVESTPFHMRRSTATRPSIDAAARP